MPRNAIYPRILHITNAGGHGRVQFGGGERAVEELSRKFGETAGWSAAVCAPNEFFDGAAIDPAVHVFGVPLSAFAFPRALRPRSPLMDVMATYRPNVVIAHLLRGSLIGIPLGRLARVPVVSILHNSLADAEENRPLPSVQSWLNLGAFRSVGRLATMHVAISPSNHQDLITKDHMPSERVITINNWVSSAFTSHPILSGSTKEHFELLVVGRLEAQKQQEFAIRLIQQLPDDATLTLVGEGSLNSEYRNLVHKFGLDERVKFLGRRRDIPELMARADVVLVPSRFEGFGRVAVEAMSVGTPVLASNVAGLRDVAEAALGPYVQLLKPGDVAAWTEAVHSVRSNPPTVVQREELRRYAQSRFSLEASADAYRELVLRVLRHG